MKIFAHGKYNVVCDYKSTRSGFKHTANLLCNGWDTGEEVKCCYQNRTWERFTYQSVLRKIVDNSKRLTDEEKEGFRKEWSL